MEDSVYDYNHLGSRFNKIVSLLIIVVLCFLIFYFVTSAWFGESEVASKVMVVGDIELVVETKLEFPKDLLEPNKHYDNMPTTITCVEGTDDAYIKVKLVTDYDINIEKDYIIDGYEIDPHVIYPVLNLEPYHEAEGELSWIYCEEDDCYYYVGYVAPGKTVTFNTGIVVSNQINNVDKSKPVNITLTVYAVQRYYSAYTSENGWEFAPEEWKAAIADYDVRDCWNCSKATVGANDICQHCGAEPTQGS